MFDQVLAWVTDDGKEIPYMDGATNVLLGDDLKYYAGDDEKQEYIGPFDTAAEALLCFKRLNKTHLRLVKDE